jgi:putative flippase GtrA
MLRMLYKKLPHRLFRFLCVGAIGFVIDASILSMLIFDFGWGHYVSRVVSFGVAVPFSWLLNRMWTFKGAATNNPKREYTIYMTIQATGALLNFAIYSTCIFLSSTMMNYPVLALAIGSV